MKNYKLIKAYNFTPTYLEKGAEKFHQGREGGGKIGINNHSVLSEMLGSGL